MVVDPTEPGQPAPGRSLRVCAVVVTYRPQPELLARVLDALLPQVDQVLLLDNASPGEDPGKAASPRLRQHRCRRNRGLAWTQNLGARWAWRQGFDAVLTMDQDSVPAADMVARLIEVATGPDRARLAAVAARPVDARSGRPFPILTDGPVTPGSAWVACEFTIASGMLITREAWRAVGPMRAELFIDHVDTDWCLRARAGGWLLALVPRARLEHRLGDGGLRLWLGRWRWLPFHSPLRHYYMVRNSRWLDRQPYAARGASHRTLLRAVGVVLLSLVFLAHRRERAGMVWQAWHDAGAGRMGGWRGRKPGAVAPGAHTSAEGRQTRRTEGSRRVRRGMD